MIVHHLSPQIGRRPGAGAPRRRGPRPRRVPAPDDVGVHSRRRGSGDGGRGDRGPEGRHVRRDRHRSRRPCRGSEGHGVVRVARPFYTETDAQGGYRLDGMPAEPCRLRFDAPGNSTSPARPRTAGWSTPAAPHWSCRRGRCARSTRSSCRPPSSRDESPGRTGCRSRRMCVSQGPSRGVEHHGHGRPVHDRLPPSRRGLHHLVQRSERRLGSEYFGGGVTREEATVVTLGTGEVRSDIDAQLDAVAQARVVLTGPDGEPAGSVSVERVGAGATPGG